MSTDRPRSLRRFGPDVGEVGHLRAKSQDPTEYMGESLISWGPVPGQAPFEIGVPSRSKPSWVTAPCPDVPQSRAKVTRSSSSSAVADYVRRDAVALDPLEEALVELARSALRNRRAAAERRAKMTTVEGGKRGGRTA